MKFILSETGQYAYVHESENTHCTICIRFNTEAPQEAFVWELDWWLVAQDPFASLK